MSAVPAAVSKVSENPPANAVTHTIGEKQKKADVDRKIRFYGVIEAFRQGRMPDNRQIDETLRYAQAKSPVKLENLSDDGKKLVHDFRAIIDTAREMVLEKNANEEVQNFIYASRQSSVADKAGVNPSISKEDARKDAQNAGQAFETIIKLFLRNGEFRKLIEDAGVIGRDVFADAAVKTSELARPDEDRLANVDQPAPEGEFHDDIPQALKPKTQEEKEAAQAEKEAEKARAKVRAQQAADKMDPNDPTSQGNQQVAQQKAIEQKNALLNKIPDEHRERIAEHKDKTIDYMKEKFPEERRDQFIYRLKKVLVECQRHRDWQDSMSFILNAFETYKGHAADIHDQALDSSKNVRGEGNVASAETAFRTLIERFANGRPTQPLLNAVDQIYTDVKNDPELRDWFKRLDSYVRRALLEPGYIMKDEADRDAKQLQQSGRKFFVAAEPGQQQGKYKPHVDQIWDELTTFTDGFAKDPLNQKFGRQWKNLFNDLIYDESGKPEFKSHLLSDIMQTILPELLVSVSYVPLPRIEYTDNEVDLVIENIAAAPINLLPNIIEFEANNYVKASAFKGIDSRHKHSFTLTLSQIHLEMRDVFFQMNKKSGFKTKQSGFADIFLGGKGLSIVAQIEGGNEPRGRRSRNVFVVKDVKATIDTLDFAVRKSKHDTLIKLLRPLAKSIAKKQIAKAAEGGIRQALEQLNRQLTDARNTAYDAEPGSKMDAVKAKAQREKEDKQRKAEANAPKGTFKVPTSKRESVLPNLGTKEGWINKLDERAELAKQSGKANKDWHSPAFNIVDASGLPKDGYNAKTGDSHKGRNAALGAAGAGAAGAGAAGLANKSGSNNKNTTSGGTIPTGAAHVPSGTTSSSTTAGQQQQYAQPQQQQYAQPQQQQYAQPQQQQYAQPQQQQSSGAGLPLAGAGLPLAGAGLVGGAGGLAAGSHGQSQQPQQAGAIPAGAGYGSAGAYNQQPSSVAGGNYQGGEMPASTTNFGASPLTASGQGQGQQQSSGGYSGAAPALNNAVQSNSIEQNSGLVHGGRQ